MSHNLNYALNNQEMYIKITFHLHIFYIKNIKILCIIGFKNYSIYVYIYISLELFKMLKYKRKYNLNLFLVYEC